MKNSKKILVEELDSATIDEIFDEIEEKEKIPGDQFLDLDMKSPNGNIHDALEITDKAHETENVNLRTSVSGDADITGTIIAAAGKPGYREAKLGAKFAISVNGPYPSGTTASGLSEDDKTILDVLSSISGKRKAILGHIIKGIPISSNEAKKCGLIDNIKKFQSKYRLPKKGNGNVNSAGENPKSNVIPPAPPVPKGNQKNQLPTDQVNQNPETSVPEQVTQKPPARKRGRKRKN